MHLSQKGGCILALDPPKGCRSLCDRDLTGPICHFRGALTHRLELSEEFRFSEELSPCFSFLALDLGQTWYSSTLGLFIQGKA